MTTSEIFQLINGLLFVVCGGFIKRHYDIADKHYNEIQKIQENIQHVQLNYVLKTDLQEIKTIISDGFDKLDKKLDNKMDRNDCELVHQLRHKG
jgi:hypothetical protein